MIIDNELDLVDEMEWEDSDKVEFITLSEAGLEDKICEDVMDWQTNYYIEEN